MSCLHFSTRALWYNVTGILWWTLFLNVIELQTGSFHLSNLFSGIHCCDYLCVFASSGWDLGVRGWDECSPGLQWCDTMAIYSARVQGMYTLYVCLWLMKLCVCCMRTWVCVKLCVCVCLSVQSAKPGGQSLSIGCRIWNASFKKFYSHCLRPSCYDSRYLGKQISTVYVLYGWRIR